MVSKPLLGGNMANANFEWATLKAPTIEAFEEKFKETFERLTEGGRTPALWVHGRCHQDLHPNGLITDYNGHPSCIVIRMPDSWWSNLKLHLVTRRPLKVSLPMGTTLFVALAVIGLAAEVTTILSKHWWGWPSQKCVEQREDEKYWFGPQVQGPDSKPLFPCQPVNGGRCQVTWSSPQRPWQNMDEARSWEDKQWHRPWRWSSRYKVNEERINLYLLQLVHRLIIFVQRDMTVGKILEYELTTFPSCLLSNKD